MKESLSSGSGTRTSMEEVLESDDSSDEDESDHFRLGRAIGRRVGRMESSEDVELTSDMLPVGEEVEKFLCGTILLDTSGLAAGLR